MKIGPLSPGAVGVDLDSPLSAASCQALLALDRPNPRISFAMRYLGDLDTGEAETITGSGLGLGAVTHPRSQVDAQYGTLDGQHAVQRAQFASLPQGMHLFLDLESWSGDAIGYVNAWSAEVLRGGYIPALYVGYAAQPLTPAELANVTPTLYWRSASLVPEPASISWALIQSHRVNTVLAGLKVDIDLVDQDVRGRLPIVAWSSQDAPTMPGRKSSGAMAAVRR